MSVDTPAWVRDAVFYQIFPDRFAASDRVPKPGTLCMAGQACHAMPGTPLVAKPRMADATHPAPRPGEHSAVIRDWLGALND